MKYYHCIFAMAALVAVGGNFAFASSIGASTNVTTGVIGIVSSSGNASAVVVGTSVGVANATAVTSPNGQTTKLNATNVTSAFSRSHVGFGGGTANGLIAAGGNSAASAWVH